MIVHTVEQRSPEWYALRTGIPTASEFSKLVTSKGEASKSADGYALTLAAEMFAGKPVDVWEGNAWTERGREIEEHALTLYEFTRDVEIAPVGFVTDDAQSMGCSPDGLIGDDGMIEVKCLKAENHVKAILYFQKHGRCPTDYVQQTQGQLMICERAWCDLLFHHPELPPLIIRQEPDAEIHAALRTAVPSLLAERDRVLAALQEHAGMASERKAA
jgi:hypothetical protein